MILFLSEVLILAIHEDQINLYGGDSEVRDFAILDAALNMPKVQFEGEFLHTSIFHMAAAYGFHISEGQPFVDGNKRTGGMAMFTFLKINGFEPSVADYEYYEVLMNVANKQMDKNQLANWLQKSVKKG